jgi:hypothetical protein
MSIRFKPWQLLDRPPTFDDNDGRQRFARTSLSYRRAHALEVVPYGLP